MGKVNFGGVVKEVCLAYVPEVAVGDYVLVHVGVAISKVDELSALQSLKLFEEMGILEEELHSGPSAPPDAARNTEPSPDHMTQRAARPR
jgi:hydrogenase expression/formation protein HypC